MAIGKYAGPHDVSALKGTQHRSDVRKKNPQGDDFDSCTSIQSPTYKQKGPMKNKIGKYSGDCMAKGKEGY